MAASSCGTAVTESGAAPSGAESAEQHGGHSSLLVGDQESPEGFLRTDLTAELAEQAEWLSGADFASMQSQVAPEECAALSTTFGDVFPLLSGDAPSAAVASFAEGRPAEGVPEREISVIVDTSGGLGAPVDMDNCSEFTKAGGEGDLVTTMRYTAEPRDLDFEGADTLTAARVSTSVEEGEVAPGTVAHDAPVDVVVGTVGGTSFLLSASDSDLRDELDALTLAQVRTLAE